ncbi:MAG: four helix bundle protein [Gemmatimonadaceae bacterium]
MPVVRYSLTVAGFALFVRSKDARSAMHATYDQRVADFRKLRVWEAAQQLAIASERVAGRMHGTRRATLRDQLLRAAMSVPTNIVEGSAHASPRQFARYLGYAIASVTELEGHVQLARDLKLITEQDFTSLLGRIVDVRKMLHGLLKKLRGNS